MEQFSLDKWLKDKSHKVVTRDRRPVRIVCWDLKCNTPIIAAIQWNQEREDCYCYNTIGRCANNVGELDLFFADEEEKTIDDTEMNSLAYLTELGYTCILPKKEQQPEGWSEEDEEYYMIVKESILERWKGTDNKELIEIRNGALNWLKYLKPCWKLTDGQMKETLQTEYEKGRFDMMEEMMKDAVEGTVKYEIGSAVIPQCDRRYQVLSDPTPIANAKLGDKVKIIILKIE